MIHGNEDLSPVIFTFQGRTPDPVWYNFGTHFSMQLEFLPYWKIIIIDIYLKNISDFETAITC